MGVSWKHLAGAFYRRRDNMWAGLLLIAALSLSGYPAVWAQSDLGAPGYGDSGGSSLGSAAGQVSEQGLGGAAGGGAAMADFDTLMNLIQQTIDPDSWLANGGTSTILPYPSGVHVDPRGHVKHILESERLAAFALQGDGPSKALRHPWRTESRLRTVSLKGLDQALQAAAFQGLPATAELLQLAGLSKIHYVKIDVAHEDILIAGPAADATFGFELQDVAVLAALIQDTTQPLGCSIEPRNEGILAAQQMLQSDGALKRLARNPRMVVEQIREKVGPHQVHVFGMDSNTGTAIALIDADEHMKKVGLGTVQTSVRINSYFHYLDLQEKAPEQSLIRWWFAYSDQPIRVDPNRELFQLPDRCVSVMSEQQWVSQQGRSPTGGHDVAADSFAAGISENLSRLRESHPAYARLSAVFEVALALQLAVEVTGQPSLQAWLPTLCDLGRSVPESNPTPRTVEGLTTWHQLHNGTVVAVVSGGVKVDALQLARQEAWEPSRFLTSSVVPDSPETRRPAHAQWWWD